jgi:hypothetical protein
MKNLIVCCDGTWSTQTDTEEGLPSLTNVAKLYNAVLQNDGQVAYYHPGVGTGKGWWNRVAGGGTGHGLDQNIMSGYHYLALRYATGDRIFLFGFSRGAYTVRSLGGLIAKFGLLDLTDPLLSPNTVWERVGEVFDAYRRNAGFTNPKAYPFHKGDLPDNTVPIHFLGVWDTVGALGIPDDLALLGLLDDADKYRFHDTKLSPKVKHGRHALALDEKRASFAPTLWTKTDGVDVKQIWFPGVHSDVGGGYLQTSLSDGALAWMMDEAVGCGLELRAGTRDQVNPDHLGVVHDSYDGVFKFLKSKPRSVPCVGSDCNGQFHESASKRYSGPPIAQGAYWTTTILPAGEKRVIDIYARERWNFTGLFLEAGTHYKLAASGEWLDGATAFSPDGTEAGTFSADYIGRFVSSVLGSGEAAFLRLTGGQQPPDFWFTRREEARPWFALIGFVASEEGMTDGSPAAGETFLIGAGMEYTPKQSGYLYCFANDAWQTYENNRGAVALTVSR